ncbi:IclR family transcriptional regulator [Echinimonas agarilytica]|uniref:IclR family transcriptional regulator n=1 Tax=Echinimonas agarilytica TaxID=1215918 RepID=A0AA41W6R4_9GAMM|nr:IclR family transcriptional regulator [Echinimonas agarilytica]MCM2679604.1 IclR family transcriptional regulator [Echinimonas agarilytica]
MTTTKANKYAVPALDKGLDILEFLATKDIPLSQKEIADGIDRSANEIYRVLVGLESRGYLIRDDVSGKYRVSLKLFTLSRRLSPIDKLRQTAIPIMEDFAANHGHSCHLSMLHQSQVMVVVQARSPAPVSLAIAEGTLFPSVQSTSGRLLLAHSKEAVRELIYERDEDYVAMNTEQRQALDANLNDIVKKGYCFTHSLLTEGVTVCAAIVGEPNGAVIAALSVSSLTSSIGKDTDQQALIEAVIDTANKISERVGC